MELVQADTFGSRRDCLIIRFLGIGRPVEVGERSRDRAVTVTFKSDLPENGVELLARLSASDRYTDRLGCPKFGPAPARCVRTSARHRSIYWRSDCDGNHRTRF